MLYIIVLIILFFGASIVISVILSIFGLSPYKTCPSCAEKIKRKAVVCKFCHKKQNTIRTELPSKKTEYKTGGNYLLYLFLLVVLTFLFLGNYEKAETENYIENHDEKDNYVDNGDGTVTHKKTGLTWQKCSVGQVWNGITCEGNAQRFSWYGATTSFQHIKDWHLPTKNELVQLVYCSDGNYQKFNIDKIGLICSMNKSEFPTINLTYFPNSPKGWFASSSEYIDNSDSFWYVSFYNGSLDRYGKNSDLFYVRLVHDSKNK